MQKKKKNLMVSKGSVAKDFLLVWSSELFLIASNKPMTFFAHAYASDSSMFSWMLESMCSQ